MGLLLSLPLAGGLGTVASSCLAGIAFCFTSTAASMFFKSCNCNSSIATRVGFAIIFSLNSILAWIMKTEMVIDLIRKWSYDYIKMDCANDKCYGVHRICFALTLLHTILSLSLIGVKDTRDKRAAIQNGWWGPKVLLWFILVIVSFFIPNPFFIFWGNYVSLIGATVFILLGLVLLVDFAHTWSETCLDNWENSDGSSNLWQWILIGSTATMYIFTITMTGLLFAYFAGSGCTLNRFFIGFNLALSIVITLMCVHPTVQEYNPRSGLAHETTARRTAAVLGAIFTFLAIAYSTTRAATQSRALVRKGKRGGAVQLPDDGFEGHAELGVVNKQPSKTDSPRYQALLAAVEAGAIPASALQEEDSDDEDDEIDTETRDDERTGTRYNVRPSLTFGLVRLTLHSIPGSTNVVSDISKSGDPNNNIYIGRSEVAMWMRVVSSWICMLLYTWSLLAPVLLPDRFGDL
ncbi:serine incorporator/TMS membrane protein [Mycena olivaceomarginata]|nr:serine incorporator/TMS membrane protein [Mycena olivaceomarginata]